MQTAGELLKEARLKSKLTFAQIERSTKIPVKTLVAIEKSQFKQLPSFAYIKGLIQNYAKTVNLDTRKIIAIFKRDYDNQTVKKIIPKGVVKPLNSRFNPTQKTKTILGLSLVTLLFVIYLSLSLLNLNQPPKLEIFKPENGQELSNPVLIKGKTNHDATLTLNGKTINLESDGNFTTVFNGPIGTHELKIKSTSRRNKFTQTSRHIIITN